LSGLERSVLQSITLTTIHLSASIEVLGEECFRNCQELESVTFESGLRLSRSKKLAFYSSGLRIITIPASVERIGHFCFAFCASLETVKIEAGSQFSRIESAAFLFRNVFKKFAKKALSIVNHLRQSA
jgi:hypothetical protein